MSGAAALTPGATPAASAPAAAEEPAKPAKAPAKPSRAKRGKAPMPSWEDVLLGVRSSGH
ncbi:septation protein SepH [Nocardia abscessus]|uniref:septation protein SepH n=1 Tax=Nocardia abscessus TaxID=120957 RepID=UPI002456336B|nr:septation protein SepH [Nocardia abscessus]